MDQTGLTNGSDYIFYDDDFLGMWNTTELPVQNSPTLRNIRILFYKLFLPIICLIGISGNCMAMLVIRTSYALKRLPSNFYLCALALNSTLFLSTVLLSWLEKMLRWPIFNLSNAGCKLLTFFAHYSDFCCIWLIVAVSTDRMLILYWPKWRRKVWTFRVVKRTVATISVVSGLASMWCLILANVVLMDGYKMCAFQDHHKDAYIVFHTIDIIICIIIPSTVIIFVNSTAVYRYRRYTKMQMMTATVRFRNSKDSTDLTFLPVDNNVVNQPNNGNNQQNNGYQAKRQSFIATLSTPRGSKDVKKKLLRPADLQLTKIILTITTLFLCLNLPSYIFRVVFTVYDGEILFSFDTDTFIEFFAYICYYLHFAILFYLYIFWSPQMMKELKPAALKLLECYCFKTVPDFGHEVIVENPEES